MEDHRITDDQITASSDWTRQFDAYNGRLNEEQRSGSNSAGVWCAEKQDLNQWISVDLNMSTLVSGVITQGRLSHHVENWVTKFKIQYSDDGDSWQYILSSTKQEEKVRIICKFLLKCNLY